MLILTECEFFVAVNIRSFLLPSVFHFPLLPSVPTVFYRKKSKYFPCLFRQFFVLILVHSASFQGFSFVFKEKQSLTQATLNSILKSGLRLQEASDLASGMHEVAASPFADTNILMWIFIK